MTKGGGRGVRKSPICDAMYEVLSKTAIFAKQGAQKYLHVRPPPFYLLLNPILNENYVILKGSLSYNFLFVFHYFQIRVLTFDRPSSFFNRLSFVIFEGANYVHREFSSSVFPLTYQN